MPGAAYGCKQEAQPSVTAKLSLSRWMRRVSINEFDGKTPGLFWQGMVSQVGKHRQWLVDIFNSEIELIKHKLALGLGMGYGKSQQPHGKHGAGTRGGTRGTGKRASGGDAHHRHPHPHPPLTTHHHHHHSTTTLPPRHHHHRHHTTTTTTTTTTIPIITATTTIT